jgi:hypothetical protein
MPERAQAGLGAAEREIISLDRAANNGSGIVATFDMSAMVGAENSRVAAIALSCGRQPTGYERMISQAAQRRHSSPVAAARLLATYELPSHTLR